MSHFFAIFFLKVALIGSYKQQFPLKKPFLLRLDGKLFPILIVLIVSYFLNHPRDDFLPLPVFVVASEQIQKLQLWRKHAF
jgi:purine-cytosine permease-like protein